MIGEVQIALGAVGFLQQGVRYFSCVDEDCECFVRDGCWKRDSAEASCAVFTGSVEAYRGTVELKIGYRRVGDDLNRVLRVCVEIRKHSHQRKIVPITAVDNIGCIAYSVASSFVLVSPSFQVRSVVVAPIVTARRITVVPNVC